jgi:predicted kinase
MQSLLLLVGTPGSGKTHFSEYWCKRFPNFKRISQDDLGSRLDCEMQTRKYIKKGFDVIIDRCNFNKSQRKVWINLSRELNVYIDCIYLDIPIEVSQIIIYYILIYLFTIFR